MIIKKIQLNPDQLYMLRKLLEAHIEDEETAIINSDYSEAGILKATQNIYVCAQIIEKINFDIIK